MKKKLFLLGLILFALPLMVNAESVEVDSLKCPVIGGKPTYVGTTPHKDIENFEERWVNNTDHKVLGANETFEAGKRYTYEYGFKLKNPDDSIWLQFTSTYEEECSYALGGVGTSPINGYLSSGIGFYMGDIYEYEWLDDTIDLNISQPTINQKAPLAQNGANYTVNSQKWYNITDNKEMGANETFAAKKKYKYEIYII